MFLDHEGGGTAALVANRARPQPIASRGVHDGWQQIGNPR
jgi:hypothetical protein